MTARAADGVFAVLVGWVVDGARWVIAEVVGVMDALSRPRVTAGWFTGYLTRMAQIAGGWLALLFLAAVLRGIAGRAVPIHDSTDLTDQLTAHRLEDTAGQLHTAHTRRRAATTLLRRLADLDDHGLVDRDQLPGLLDRVANNLRAAGDALVTADGHLITALTYPDPRR